MPNKYFITKSGTKTDITKAIAVDKNDVVNTELTSSFNGKLGYLGEDITFIDGNKVDNVLWSNNVWGDNTIEVDRYKSNGTPIKFCTAESATYPIVDENSTYIPFKWKVKITNKAWVWYDTRTQCIVYSTNEDLTNPITLFKADGIFIALQGAGGGGGHAGGYSVGVWASYYGAGGGGSGGFCLVYFNLRKYKYPIEIEVGKGGKGGGYQEDGKSGGNTIIRLPGSKSIYDIFAKAGGGGGGGWGGGSQAGGAAGGYWAEGYRNDPCYDILWGINGKKGGAAHGTAGWIIGGPLGHKSADYGGYYNTTDGGIVTRVLQKIPNIRRVANATTTSTSYYGQGYGQYGTWGDSYWAEGGGGGGAVCSWASGGLDASGYGAGGYGGCADPNFQAIRFQGHDGQDGVAFILDIADNK